MVSLTLKVKITLESLASSSNFEKSLTNSVRFVIIVIGPGGLRGPPVVAFEIIVIGLGGVICKRRLG